MAKRFQDLRMRMSPEARARSEAMAQKAVITELRSEWERTDKTQRFGQWVMNRRRWRMDPTLFYERDPDKAQQMLEACADLGWELL